MPARNDPCSCGSGKKFKHCCGGKVASRAAAPSPDEFNQLVDLYNAKRYAELENRASALVRRYPDFGLIWKLLGVSQQMQGKNALPAFQKTAQLMPGDADAHYILGNVLKDLGQIDEAVASYQSALKISPDFAEAHNNLGVALRDLGQSKSAMASFRRALMVKPDLAETYNNIGNIQSDIGQNEEAIASYRRALEFKPDYVIAYSNLLYLHAVTRSISPESERDLATNWENIVLNESERAAARNRIFDNSNCTGRKLRIGVVSAEIGQHAVAEFLEPFLEQLNRSKFHVTLYPTTARLEPRVAQFRKLADEFKSLVGISDNKAADLIRLDSIDILIDTTAHMKGCRLGIFAHRAAPVQCHYIGYHGSTGLSEMDWFISDGVLLPPAYDSHFRESIWRLPRLWIAYRGDTSLPGSKWKPSEDGTIWLGSFNNLSKVREQSLALWARVMNALPDSKLLLKDGKAADGSVRERITTELGRVGISAERIEFASKVPDWHAHMQLYDRLDIALDPIPLNSGTTAFDALWMGVPLVALEGDWMGARMTSAILNALGKPEWVAQNEDDYVDIITTLARDVSGRKSLRSEQRTLMANSPLCDAKDLTGALQSAFEEMFDLWSSNRASIPNKSV